MCVRVYVFIFIFILKMDIMTQSIQCNLCQQSFDDLSMRNNHVKAVHQKSVGVIYSNGVKKRIG